MKITALSAQLKNPDRINVFVDGQFRFGLDIRQVVELGIKVGLELDEARLNELELESQFGKLYVQALNYCLLRPHSVREVRDYLWKKSQPKLLKSGRKTAGLPASLTQRVLERLMAKQYLDDYHFAKWWLANRRLKQGVSLRRLRQELAQKGINQDIIDQLLAESTRDDATELQKIIAKKAHRYSDRDKLMRYLASQGFNYDDIKQALTDNHHDN